MRTELDDYIATRADVRAYLDRALSDAETHSQQEATLFEMVKDKLLQSGARLVAHYYVDSEIQRLIKPDPNRLERQHGLRCNRPIQSSFSFPAGQTW